MSPLRCFVAVEIADDLREALGRAQQGIRHAQPAWRDERWVAAELMHVTVKFLGDVEEGELPALSESLATVAATVHAFELRAARLRAVPAPRRCRMIWAAFEDPEGACAELARAVDAAALLHGIAAETKGFSAHVTLCRARRPKPVSAEVLQEVWSELDRVGDSMSVGSVSLVSSRLGRGQPEYTTLASWALEG